MSTKVLVLGASGMIGHSIYSLLKNNINFKVYGLSRSNKVDDEVKILNVKNNDVFETFLKKINPQIVINCIGLLIEDSEKNLKDSIYLNAYFPHHLVFLGKKFNFKLMHISTDCVYSGNKKQPYVENDFKDGNTVYARTKALGEVVDKLNLTIRTSVVGPDIKSNGGELFNWFMTQNNLTISGFTNAYWSGVTSFELAKAVKWAIDYKITGLYNLTNCKKINKYELLKLFAKHTKKEIEIVPTETKFSDKSFIDTRKLINYQIPDYDLMIEELISYTKENKSLYPHYKF